MRERLLKFLRQHQVVTLAVTEADDSSYAVALFYAADDELRLYVATDPETRHGQAMSANTQVAGTIQRDRQRWQNIQGVQFRGVCRPLGGEERTQAWELYTARFPFLRQSNTILTRKLTKTAMWRVDPTWVRLIDNEVEFGHKEEWTPPTRKKNA